jgi:hypothetical protein
MIPIVSSSLPTDPGALSENITLEPGANEDWVEFSSHFNANIDNDASFLDSFDQSKLSLQHALEVVAAHPSGQNVFDATRHLSNFDLKTLVLGKVVDKVTKGIDRMMNMQ